MHRSIGITTYRRGDIESSAFSHETLLKKIISLTRSQNYLTQSRRVTILAIVTTLTQFHVEGDTMEYAVRLYDDNRQVVREALYLPNKKAARAALAVMLKETAEAVAYGIDEMTD